MNHLKFHFYFLLLFAFFIYLLIYFPGLNGDFEFDDRVNILDNSKLQISSLSYDALKQAAFSGHAGPTKRPISSISFAINYYFSGFNPYAYKLTNIIIHLLNGILLFIFSFKLLSLFPCKQLKKNSLNVKWFALAISFTWLIAPINLTSVLYIVQRMNSLSTLFVLSALILYIYGRQLDINQHNGRYSLFYSIILGSIFGLLGIFSKENAALLPAYLLLIECFIFKFKSSSLYIKKLLILYYICSIFLLIYIISPGLPVSEWEKHAYAFRSFNLIERLLTESRIIINYIYLTVLPDNHLLGLYHDDIVVSTSIIQPITTLYSIITITILLGIGVYLIRKKPLISFAIFWFFISHLLESTFIPLELMHEHRNYLASFGIFLALYLLYFLLIDKVKQKTLLYVLLIIYITHTSITTYSRASEWSNLALHAKLEAQNHPESYRAQYQLARVYFLYYIQSKDNKFYNLAEQQFDKLSYLKNSSIEEYIGKIILLSVSDKPNKAQLETKLLQTLTKKILNLNIPSNKIPAINSLSDCMLRKQCHVSNQVYIFFMNQLVNKAHLNKKSKAFIYIYLGDYYREIMLNPQKALQQYQMAIALDPNNIQFQIRYMIGLANTGQYNKASRQLNFIKKIDKFGLYKIKIDNLEYRLKAIQNTINRTEKK